MKIDAWNAISACPHCDWLQTEAKLDGDSLRCRRCGSMITRYISDAPVRTMCFAGTGIIALGLALSFPFLGFSAGGREQSMTLLEAGTALINTNQLLLGVIVLSTIVLLPLMLLLILLTAAFCLHAGRHHRWLPWLGRLLHEIDHWSMVEVFLIGVLVSLTKIASMATISFGLSFWAFVVFCIVFVAANASLDRQTYWRFLRTMS